MWLENNKDCLSYIASSLSEQQKDTLKKITFIHKYNLAVCAIPYELPSRLLK